MPSMDSVGIYGDGETIALEVIARGTATRPFAGREVEPLARCTSTPSVTERDVRAY